MFRINKKANILVIDTGDYHDANRIVSELLSYTRLYSKWCYIP